MVTDEQKRIADELLEWIKDLDPEVIRQNIRQENEYFKRKEAAQRPTREQMQQEYNI